MQYDIFLSYRRSDQPIARAVVSELEARGVNVWWDQLIEGGEDWRDAIVAGLEASSSLVILFSEDCNASKQLKKELAIADTLNKLIVPVLIENTQPKGHYLYELAALNWIQIFPDAHKKAAKLADRLVDTLESAGLRASAPAMAMAEPVFEAAPDADVDMAGIDGAAPAPAPVARAPQPHPSPSETAATARAVEAKVQKSKARDTRAQTRRDFLPFKWIDILPVGALTGLFIGLLIWEDLDLSDFYDWGMQSLLSIIICTAAYGALIFPVRYYMRRRRLVRTAVMYLSSSAVLYAAFAAAITHYNESFDFEIIYVFGIIWVVFAVVALVIYAILHAQRALRSFRKNVEVL